MPDAADGRGSLPLCDLALLFPRWRAAEFRRLARLLLGASDPSGRASAADRLVLGLWEFMSAVGFVSDAQGRAVLAEMRPALDAAAAGMAAGGDVLPAFHVVFSERRWVAWPTRDAWFDMVEEVSVASLPEPSVLSVVCDVTALYLRQEAWLERLKGGKDAGPGTRAARGG